MALNEELVYRIKEQLDSLNIDHIEMKKMFGGVAFLYKGKMTVGVTNDDLMVRVVGEKMEKVFEMSGVREMDFTKRSMKEFIFVSADGYDSAPLLAYWIELGLEHAKRKLNER